VRKHGKWAKASRADGYFTVDDLEALHDDYLALVNKYAHSAQDAPPGARSVQLRMFYIPDDPAAADPAAAEPAATETDASETAPSAAADPNPSD
jgi:hypothetical protein